MKATRTDWAATVFAGLLLLLSLALAFLVISRGSKSDPVPGPRSAADGRAERPIKRDENALLLARRAGDVVIGIAAKQGGPVDVMAIPADLRRLPAGSVRAELNVEPTFALPTSCGWNCFRLDGAGVMRGIPATLNVVIDDGGRELRAAFPLPKSLPRAASPLLRAVNRTMAGLRTVRMREVLSSGRASVSTEFIMQAPDRLSYVSSNGARGIVIGSRRWDRKAGRWEQAAAQSVRTPTLIWRGAGHARLIGTAMRTGRRVRILAAFRDDERYPAWFRLFVGGENRVVEAEMLAPAHFMSERFTDFDAPLAVSPPE